MRTVPLCQVLALLHPSFAHKRYMYVMSKEDASCFSIESSSMIHEGAKLWACVWKIIKDGCGNERSWASRQRGSSKGCNALERNAKSHSCLWCSFKPLKAAVWSVRGGVWKNVIVFIVGALDCKENSTDTWKHPHPGSNSVSLHRCNQWASSYSLTDLQSYGWSFRFVFLLWCITVENILVQLKSAHKPL